MRKLVTVLNSRNPKTMTIGPFAGTETFGIVSLANASLSEEWVL